MIFQLIERIRLLLQRDSDLTEVREIKQVDDVEAYDDYIKLFPSIGIQAVEEVMVYREDTREVQHVFTPMVIRVYTRHESSPEAARRVLGILTWKVINALRKNPQLTFAEFDPEVYLIDSEPNNIIYGSRRKDKAFDEYATIKFNTRRPEVEPESDETYYDVIQTMLRVSLTGMGGGTE